MLPDLRPRDRATLTAFASFLLCWELLENLARNPVRGLLTSIPDPRKNGRSYLALRVMPKLLAAKEENRYGRRLGRQ